MPRYCILFHETPPEYPRPSHWDVLLESGEALRTWALAEEPRAGLVIAAEALPDHRLSYLTYEGAVSGERGWVNRWDSGEFRWIDDQPDRLTIELCGQRLCGEAHLKTAAPGSGRWEFVFLASRPQS